MQVDAFHHGGKLNWLRHTDTMPGGLLVLNANTGMVGVATQTPFGIAVRVLLNPRIGPGTLGAGQQPRYSEGTVHHHAE